ncbi:hypothetical protein ACT3CD_10385 [Geofilum sp. OHC36d9]|uniref:hypothetical protein n=1 Tax=Geofilum sp. OHC36d9 TaxID=3458413 RepID=UPI004033A6D7
MNLQELDVHRLTILWQASGGNLQLKKLIESELQKRIVSNTNFSREYLFKVSKVQNHAITISFIPTTDSYNEYGANVTVDLLLDDVEMEELLKNYSAKSPINTSGQLKAKALVKDRLNENQLSRLENIGFHTKEILEVLHL